MRNDRMYLAAFSGASVTHSEINSWAHPAARTDVVSPGYYIDLARTVEAAGFDLLFFDDRLAMPAAYGNSPAEAVRIGARVLKLDLLTILSLVAGHTSTLGLGGTYSTTYYAPYHVARAFATLDLMSQGRAVWNIVTSLNENEAENMGVDYLDPGRRYDRADEFLEIVTRLWESWEPDALVVDRHTDVFGHPEKVHEIDYTGSMLRSRGPLTVPRPPQGWPLLLQAGQSGRGMTFAARWADMIFTGAGSLEGSRRHYARQQDLFGEVGRPRGAGKVLPLVNVFLGETTEIARRKSEFFNSRLSTDEAIVLLSERSSFDFSKIPLDKVLDEDLLNAITGLRGALNAQIESVRAATGVEEVTLRDLVGGLEHMVRFVGTGPEVADQMEEWFEAHACDGFAIPAIDTPGGYATFGTMVVPELRRRGRLPDVPVDRTAPLRDRLGLPRRNAVGP